MTGQLSVLTEAVSTCSKSCARKGGPSSLLSCAKFLINQVPMRLKDDTNQDRMGKAWLVTVIVHHTLAKS